MYRVELKAVSLAAFTKSHNYVPNVPCGVESTIEDSQSICSFSFLMYRVELKENKVGVSYKFLKGS